MLRTLLVATTVGLAAAGASSLNNPCLDTTQPYHKQPWCDSTLDIDSRVKDMVSVVGSVEKEELLGC